MRPARWGQGTCAGEAPAAGLEVRNGRYNVIVRFGGKRFVRSLKTASEKETLTKKLRIEESLQLIGSGRVEVPIGSDFMTVLLSDGKLSRKLQIEASTHKLTQTHRRHLAERGMATARRSVPATLTKQRGILLYSGGC